jgi:BirA family transcriptional regulator, biotin operon repressor / biotin---[acetyl-CoA-carboxylase] ligase
MWDIQLYESVDSTNLEAQRLLDAGASPGLVVAARHQTGGRGRMGRGWLDLPGKSLLVSLVLGEVGGFESSVLVAISARAAIVASRGEGPRFKWPNDLVYGGRKVGGILSEAYSTGSGRAGSRDSRDENLTIIGLGLNLGYLPGELDIPAGLPPTSLLIEEGKILNSSELLSELLRQLESRWMRGREEWMDEYRENLAFVGEVVRVSGPYALLDEAGERRDFEALLRGVDSGGNLVLEVEGGTVRLVSGDISPLEPGDAGPIHP